MGMECLRIGPIRFVYLHAVHVVVHGCGWMERGLNLHAVIASMNALLGNATDETVKKPVRRFCPMPSCPLPA